MRIAIIGTGYVGLVTGACLAEKGHDVVCVDLDRSKVDAINRSESPIFEQGLEELLVRNVGRRLRATTDTREAVLGSEITFIAVGTPFDGTRIDLTHIEESARAIGAALGEADDYHVVVVKSTVIPGTTDRVVLPILEAASGKRAHVDFGVGMNPEFLTEGEAVGDFMRPDRVICGGIDARTHAVLESVYLPFSDAPCVRTNNNTAEMVKYASNAMLATMISFSNEISKLSAALGGIDVVEVMDGVHTSRYLTTVLDDGRRVVPPIASFLMAGCGFGGSCLPKDVNALIARGGDAGIPMPLLQSVIDVNERQPNEMFRLLAKHFASLAGVQVAVLGLSFRPDTSDTRESPAIPIVHGLRERGAIVSLYDPVADGSRIFDDVRICDSLVSAVAEAEAVLVVTRWAEFEHLPAVLAATGHNPVVVDGRRMLDKSAFDRYEGIGL